jgi:DNA-binding PadR family transcriptional regulator
MNDKFQKYSPLTEATYYILLSLQRPLHGYGIIKKIENMTDGRLILASGTLYGAISKLISYNLITLVSEDINNKRKKEYLITDEGIELLNFELLRIKKMVSNSIIEVKKWK